MKGVFGVCREMKIRTPSNIHVLVGYKRTFLWTRCVVHIAHKLSGISIKKYGVI